MSNLRAELESLRAALLQAPPLPEAPPSTEVPPEIEARLKELRDALAGAADDAEEVIARHPALAIGAAFLLGLLVGRAAGRL